ncbi:hypothetical protein SUGI_0962300 [Cryptomeria japonica]|uniref:FRIGIDA-like protein 3 n=1 Tax=Cryptomeria japonica TaxID=3369 RepID=UPI002414B191|nr:FRIGIDA-like protein 3 [Cryptomeria japonica]GLJ45726.1 hypothetical protein SUGI_0962300 [Cryptomeria japonica]
MSVVDSISAAMGEVSAKRELLQKAYLELESHTSALVNFKTQWKELQDHFDTLEELMNKRSQELGIKIEEPKVAKSQAAVKGSSPAEAKKGADKITDKATDVKPRAEFKNLCEKMDAEGLLKFLVEKKKDLAALRNEAPGALKAAPKTAMLVLKALEGFFNQEQKSDKEHTLFLQRRRAGILLLETLPSVVKAEAMPAEAKKTARKLAGEWKAKIIKPADASYLEAHAYLQLLISYGLASEFRNDANLVDLIVVVARRNQAPEVCRNLGLQDKMTDIVEKLISSGKQIEAVNFVHTFGLTEKYPLVPLLRAYLKDAKKLSQDTAKNGKNSINAQNEGASKEIAAVKAVIKCIQEHKLESQMSPENLQKRMAHLEKAKADRKRSAAEAVKSQTKRPRVSNSGSAAASAAERIPTVYTSSITDDRSLLRPGMTSYSLPTPGAYDRPSQSILGSSPYGIGSRGALPLSRPYLLSSDNLHSSLYGAGSFGAPSNYGSFSLGAGLPSSSASYPSSYLR